MTRRDSRWHLLFAMGMGGIVLSLAACAPGTNAASALAKPPRYDAGPGLANCRVAKSQSEPLVVDWSSPDRARLEALSRSGLVAVRYTGCEMRVLSNCTLPSSTYRYVGTTRKHDEDHIKSADELYAKLPLGAARLEGTLHTAGELSVGMTIVGRYQFDRPVNLSDLVGDCADATHVIGALTVGAFAFRAGASAGVGGGVSAFDVGVKGNSEAEHSILSQDGLDADCDKAKADDERAPAGCGALIRVEVRVLPETVMQVRQEEKRQLEKERSDNESYESARHVKTAGYILGGSGLALIGTGVLFTFLASSAKSSIQEGGLATSGDIESTASRTSTFQGISYAGYGGGGALLLTGAGMLLFGPPVNAPSGGLAVLPQGAVARW